MAEAGPVVALETNVLDKRVDEETGIKTVNNFEVMALHGP
jgi:hypothetical protein